MKCGCSGAAQLRWVGESLQTSTKTGLQLPALLHWLVHPPHPWPSTKPHLFGWFACWPGAQLCWPADQEVCSFNEGTPGAGSFTSRLPGGRMMKRHLLPWTSSRKNRRASPCLSPMTCLFPLLSHPCYTKGIQRKGSEPWKHLVLFAGPGVPVFYKELAECPQRIYHLQF